MEKGLLRILTINVDGIREPGKILALENFVAQELPDILIVTETHLTEKEARGLILAGYVAITESSMPRDGTRIRGGVAILAKIGVTCEELKEGEVQELALPLYSCTILVFLNDEDQRELKITGVYLPPKGGQTAEKLSVLTGAKVSRMCRGRRVGHILAGDFNHPNWESGYRKWTGTQGLWELSDPEVGTFGSGNALDKFLFFPGDYIPMSFLSPGVSCRLDDASQCRFAPMSFR